MDVRLFDIGGWMKNFATSATLPPNEVIGFRILRRMFPRVLQCLCPNKHLDAVLGYRLHFIQLSGHKQVKNANRILQRLSCYYSSWDQLQEHKQREGNIHVYEATPESEYYTCHEVTPMTSATTLFLKLDRLHQASFSPTSQRQALRFSKEDIHSSWSWRRL